MHELNEKECILRQASSIPHDMLTWQKIVTPLFYPPVMTWHILSMYLASNHFSNAHYFLRQLHAGSIGHPWFKIILVIWIFYTVKSFHILGYYKFASAVLLSISAIVRRSCSCSAPKDCLGSEFEVASISLVVHFNIFTKYSLCKKIKCLWQMLVL